MLLKPWASTLFLLGLTSPVVSRSDRGLIDTLVASGASKFAAHIKSDPDVLQLFLSGQFQTLFAPDDTAFDDAALQARDLTPTQRQMLAFHAVRGETSLGIASRAIPGSVFETANESPLLGGRGQRIVTDTRPANVTVFTKRWNHQPDQRRETDAGSGPLLKITTGLGRATNVIKGDIEYDGGLIHITDSYFTLPQSLSSTSQMTGQVGFSGLLTDSDMGGALDATSSVTVFIPSNAAFAAAAAANATGAPAPELLSGHVVAGDVKYLPDLVDGSFLRAQTGEVLAVSVRDGIYYINGARITQANLVIANGVAHVVDKVLTSQPLLPAPVPTTSLLPEPVPTTSLLPEPVPTTSLLPEPVPTTSLLPEPVPTTSLLPEPVPTTSLPPAPVPTSASAKTATLPGMLAMVFPMALLLLM